MGLGQVQLPAGWETPEHTPQQHVIVVHLIREMGLERHLGDRRQQENILPGDVMLLPADVNHSTISRQPGDALLLILAPETLSHNLQELVDPSQLELIPHFAQPDTKLRSKIAVSLPLLPLLPLPPGSLAIYYV